MEGEPKLLRKTLFAQSMGKKWHLLCADHWVAITAPLMENNFSLLGATTSSKHIPQLIPKARDSKDVFPEQHWARAPGQGCWQEETELQARRAGEGMAMAMMKCRMLVWNSVWSLSVIAVGFHYLFCFLFQSQLFSFFFGFFSEREVGLSGWFGKRLRTYNLLHSKI